MDRRAFLDGYMAKRAAAAPASTTPAPNNVQSSAVPATKAQPNYGNTMGRFQTFMGNAVGRPLNWLMGTSSLNGTKPSASAQVGLDIKNNLQTNNQLKQELGLNQS